MTKSSKLFLSTLIFLASLAVAQEKPSEKIALATTNIPTDRLNVYSDLAVQWMQEYVLVDTSNPPGNEMRAVEFFKKKLDAEGIESKVFEFAPEKHRGNIIAWIKGSGKKRPIILLNHTDVVTSDPARWTVPPFSGKIVNGAIYGRGAQDMKCEGLAQLLVMVMLIREKVVLDRDVIFLATADEEANGTGTDWMIANQRGLFDNAEFLVTEGGFNEMKDGKVKYIGIDVAEKSPFWLTVTAHGKPGHGSHPLLDSAPNRLVTALQKVLAWQTELKLTPVVEEYMRVMAPYQSPEDAKIFSNIKTLVHDPEFRAAVARKDFNPSLRNTISLTMFGGSQQTNVIPGEAWANLDVRLLPDENPKEFLEKIRAVVNDPNVAIEPQSKEFRISNSSSTNTELFRVIRGVAAAYFQGTPVAPSLTSGYTENQRFRALGITSYGFSPYATTIEEGSTEHGDDERIRVEEVRRGIRVYFDVVNGIAGRQ